MWIESPGTTQIRDGLRCCAGNFWHLNLLLSMIAMSGSSQQRGFAGRLEVGGQQTPDCSPACRDIGYTAAMPAEGRDLKSPTFASEISASWPLSGLGGA